MSREIVKEQFESGIKTCQKGKHKLRENKFGIVMLAQMFAQAWQERNCEIALQACEAFVQLVQEAQAQAASPVAPQQDGVPDAVYSPHLLVAQKS